MANQYVIYKNYIYNKITKTPVWHWSNESDDMTSETRRFFVISYFLVMLVILIFTVRINKKLKRRLKTTNKELDKCAG